MGEHLALKIDLPSDLQDGFVITEYAAVTLLQMKYQWLSAEEKGSGEPDVSSARDTAVQGLFPRGGSEDFV